MLKYRALLPLAFVLTVFACDKKSESPIAGHLFKSAQTSSKKDFCSLDSVSSSDCAGGDFYFTEKGNVLYSFFCPGEDSVSYLIGKFFIADSSLTKCTFYQKYSLAVTQPKNSTTSRFDADMNSGSLKKIEPVSIRLNKLQCEKFQYYFISNGRYTSTYVLSKPTKEYSEEYVAKVSAVRSFRGL